MEPVVQISWVFEFGTATVSDQCFLPQLRNNEINMEEINHTYTISPRVSTLYGLNISNQINFGTTQFVVSRSPVIIPNIIFGSAGGWSLAASIAEMYNLCALTPSPSPIKCFQNTFKYPSQSTFQVVYVSFGHVSRWSISSWTFTTPPRHYPSIYYFESLRSCHRLEFLIVRRSGTGGSDFFVNGCICIFGKGGVLSGAQLHLQGQQGTGPPQGSLQVAHFPCIEGRFRATK